MRMKKISLSFIAGAGVALTLLLGGCDSARHHGPFQTVATYKVSGAVAEIVSATPDERLLVYTDSAAKRIGLVDISDPAYPAEVATVAVAGEPTSVAVTPDGAYALAVVHGQPDQLVIIDLRDALHPTFVHKLSGQPDSIAISPDGRFAVIAIENEHTDVDGGRLPQSPPGAVTIVDLEGDPATWRLREVSLVGVAGRFPMDPEPEFIDINRVNEAAVTLQENNHVIIIDLPTGAIVSHFSAGAVNQPADLQNDGVIQWDEQLVNTRREPDAIHWTPDGNLALANEGDYNLDARFVGGRGITIFTRTGEILFESGSALERELAERGYYDDKHSSARGSESEGIEIGVYSDARLLFVGFEGTAPGTVAVYSLESDVKPVLKQILKTGNRPEGLLALPKRNLFVTANEGDGTITLFSYAVGMHQVRPNRSVRLGDL
jgi:DNA-binding beta-propeller fold protein YncE